ARRPGLGRPRPAARRPRRPARRVRAGARRGCLVPPVDDGVLRRPRRRRRGARHRLPPRLAAVGHGDGAAAGRGRRCARAHVRGACRAAGLRGRDDRCRAGADLRPPGRRPAGHGGADRRRLDRRLDGGRGARAGAGAAALDGGAVTTPDLRRTMARLASGVSVIAARSGPYDVAITATSLVSVSLEPPLVLFAVHQDARLREEVGPGRLWAASVLSARGRSAATWLSEPGRPLIGQLVSIPHRRGETSDAAILDASTAWLEARTTEVVEAGTHDVVIGEVLATGTHPDERGAILHVEG